MVSVQASKKALVTAAVALITSGAATALVSRELITSGASGVTSLRQAQGNARASVPFLGPFAHDKKGIQECGPAVRLMEGALRHTTPPIRTGPARNCVGPATTLQLKAFQKRHDLPRSGVYTLRTHHALAHAYTRREIIDLHTLATRRLAALQRRTILVVTSHALALSGLMHYCGSGNFNGHLSNCTLRASWPAYPDVPRHTDCSGYVQWVYLQAGIPNPNGSGVGNTHSLVLRGSPVPPNGPLKVGDLVFYSFNNSHVAVYIGHGLVSSHGQPGIGIRPYAYRPIYAIHRYIVG